MGRGSRRPVPRRGGRRGDSRMTIGPRGRFGRNGQDASCRNQLAEEHPLGACAIHPRDCRGETPPTSLRRYPCVARKDRPGVPPPRTGPITRTAPEGAAARVLCSASPDENGHSLAERVAVSTSGDRPGRGCGGRKGIALRLAWLDRPGALRNPARIISTKDGLGRVFLTTNSPPPGYALRGGPTARE
jgi:hypothetical protein